MIKSRNVEQRFREVGPERASIEIFQGIIEHISAMNEQMNELTATCNKMIDMMGGVAGGYADLRRQVERVRNKQGESDEH
jgi:archaellum component FlaC